MGPVTPDEHARPPDEHARQPDEHARPPGERVADRAGESDPELVEAIHGEIEREGPITFARFMSLALYHPRRGYYMTGEERAGRTGDFLTAPEATPLFGASVARQVEEVWRRLGEPDRFVLREYGAGSGALGLPLLQRLRDDRSVVLDGLRYAPVELNGHRLRALGERLRAAGLEGHLAVEDTSGPFIGCALANEFVDALPVHRVRREGGALRELFVAWADGWFLQVPGPPSTPELAAYLARVEATLEEGQETEVNLEARTWLARVGNDLLRGVAIVIDYGHEALDLHSPRRPRGTIKGSHAQTVERDPLRRVGRQDLTSHVDLTELRLAATDLGLDVLGLTTQSAFLAGNDFGDLLREELGRTEHATRYLETRSAAVFLLDPRRIGGFRVLMLGRGVAAEPPLRGLRVRVGGER
jgi:SAM-dependent MidA family methyltransferase